MRTAAFLNDNAAEVTEDDAVEDISEKTEYDLSESIVYVTAESKNVTVRLKGGLVPSDAYHVIFFTYEKIDGGESLTRVGSDFPTEPGSYIAAIVANEGGSFFGENRSDPFTIEAAAEEANPETGAELPGMAVIAMTAGAAVVTLRKIGK